MFAGLLLIAFLDGDGDDDNDNGPDGNVDDDCGVDGGDNDDDNGEALSNALLSMLAFQDASGLVVR